MKEIVISLFLLSMCLVMGCSSPISMIAKYTSEPVVIDGKLDDSAWLNANVYTMNLARDKQAMGHTLREDGQVMVTWDDDYFYLGIKFQDSDITATGDKDQMHHYRFGDLCELFMKPAAEDNYVELYVTPRGKKTSFYVPYSNYNRPSRIVDLLSGLEVAAYVGGGTLNKRDDRDSWWSAEMAMPVKDMEKLGGDVKAGSKWRILVARYNYSKLFTDYDKEIEFSMVTELSDTSYHLVSEYAWLSLEKE